MPSISPLVVASTRPNRQSTGLPATHASHSPQRGRQSSATRSPTDTRPPAARADRLDDAGALVADHERAASPAGRRSCSAGRCGRRRRPRSGRGPPRPRARRARRPRGCSGAPISRSTAAFIGRTRRGPGRAAARPAGGSRTAQDSKANESASASSSLSSRPRNRLGVVVGERLGEGDVEQQRAHPVEPAPRVRVEVGELAGDQVLDRLGRPRRHRSRRCPTGRRRAGSSWPRSRRTGAGRGCPAAPRPGPGGRCPCTSTAPSWPNAAGRGRAGRRGCREAARPWPRPRCRSVRTPRPGWACRSSARTPSACRNFCSRLLAAVVRAAPEAGRHVVVQRVDGVVERLVEDVELGRVGVAVEEERCGPGRPRGWPSTSRR